MSVRKNGAERYRWISISVNVSAFNELHQPHGGPNVHPENPYRVPLVPLVAGGLAFNRHARLRLPSQQKVKDKQAHRS